MSSPEAPTLQVRGLTVYDVSDRAVVDDVSFDVRAGEILCVAGVQGNGQTELVEALMGLQDRVVGEIEVAGTVTSHPETRRMLRLGVGYVPEDREEDGLVSSFSLAQNLVLDTISTPRWSRRGVVDYARIDAGARELLAQFDVRARDAYVTAGTLSGGNKQKVVLARELSRDLSVLIASQPTRGLDVGSIEFVHRRLIEVRDSGVAVLIVSTELDEVYALADRILVMYQGRVAGLVGRDTPRDDLGMLMAGVVPA